MAFNKWYLLMDDVPRQDRAIRDFQVDFVQASSAQQVATVAIDAPHPVKGPFFFQALVASPFFRNFRQSTKECILLEQPYSFIP